MGWFDEQIKQRKQSDDRLFEESFLRIADAVLGERMAGAFDSDEARASGEIGEILKYYKIKPREVPEGIKGLDERLEYLLRPHGVMRRNVRLIKGWHRDAIGPMLARRRDDGTVVALIERSLRGYSYYDAASSRWVKITGRTESLFDEEAICFYRPFPAEKMTVASLMRYIAGGINSADVLLCALLVLASALVGMLLPGLTAMLFGPIAAGGNAGVLLPLGVFLVCVSLSRLLFQTAGAMMAERINAKLDLSVQAAAMMRILSLPADFFKNYGAGDLASRAQQIQSLSSMLVNALLNAGLTALCSLVYLTQIYRFAPALVAPSLLVLLCMLAFSAVLALYQAKTARRQMELAAKESGMSYALITGIQKIKLSGAEKRAYARWSRLYAEQVELTYHPPLIMRLGGVITMAISLAGALILYAMAFRSGMSVAAYCAFGVAYGMLSAAFASLCSVVAASARFAPAMEMIRPILEATPEVAQGKQVIDRISGAIELSNVSFRYREDMPLILDDLSLKIRAGQYLAIVGETGCGKSTLMRLLLGFEKPDKGAIYYNGRDLSTIDLKSLRRKIGVVMQDGKLFQGDIFSNIAISSPQLTLKEAWEAAEMAGIAEDIRRMPMGMHTIVSEGGGGISGGQRQRLMIARAIAPRPKVLMFDEATSALDNLTQTTVSDSLKALKCTRIVIAHRLSTIRACDRIIYLEQGKIVEDGTYDELIALGGRFAALVERQRLDA